MTNVLVVGQTPPPYCGQSIMIENLLRAPDSGVRMFHVPMKFSRRADEMGTFQAGKVFHLFVVIAKALAARIRHGCTTLYYPPAGHSRNGIYRDIAILLAIRPFFKHTAFHFHAGGLSEQLEAFPLWLHRLALRAYRKPDLSIRLSELNPDDGNYLGATRDVIIPYGIEDHWAMYSHAAAARGAAVKQLLCMGLLAESKGVLMLLEACRLLRARHLDFELTLAGRFGSPDFEVTCRAFIHRHGLQDIVHTPGVLTGDAKWDAFAKADVFCFPTFYESETFGVVALEAMQSSLPVIATRWRGVPSLVEDGVTGRLVPTHDSDALAEAIQEMIENPQSAAELGRNGRQRYCDSYMLHHYHSNMTRALQMIGPS